MTETPIADESPVLVKPSTVVRKAAVRQTVSVGVFLIGLAWFSYQLGEMFILHSDSGWQYFKTPMAVGEILKTAASVVMAVGGALGINVRDLFARKVAPKDTP